MPKDAYSASTNETSEDIRHWQDVVLAETRETSHSIAPMLLPEDYQTLDAIQCRVLWLCTLMIHHANHVRPNPDDLKVGGRQASSASMVSILTALYFRYSLWCQPQSQRRGTSVNRHGISRIELPELTYYEPAFACEVE